MNILRGAEILYKTQLSLRDTNNPIGLIKEEMKGRAQRRRSCELRRLSER